VQSEILRLSQFTETILDLSALDANRLPLYPEPLNLMTVVNSLREHYQHGDQYERLVWDVPPDMPPSLADQKALYSALFQILDNAFKYAPQGDITVSAKPEDRYLLISVSDHGPGISEEALPFLFDRFYRVNMADAQTIYGHGLGLYMVRRFTEAMQGRVGVQNNIHGGAKFTIRLPIVSQ
jgi:signal transduction histidine kinase